MAAKKNVKKTRKVTSKPISMEALLAKYTDGLKVFARGNRVKGKVTEKRRGSLILDIGGKSEGIITGKVFEEARGFIGNLEVGDEVETTVVVPETKDGYTLLSLRQTASDAAWKKLQEAKKTSKAVKVEAKGINPSGLMVEVSGLVGFIPNSQLGKSKFAKKESLVGEKFKALVIEIDPRSNRLVLSEKAVSESADMALTKKAMGEIKEGEIFEGKVVTISDFGCFVEIKVGKGKVPIEGLVHISELSWKKVKTPRDVVKEKDKVKVKVVGVRNGKLALSIKQAQKDPWESVENRYKKESRVKGKVVKVSDFGVFVELEPGVEGLIHITKIPPDKRFKKGDEIKAYVEDVIKKERKISLRPMLTAKPVGYK